MSRKVNYLKAHRHWQQVSQDIVNFRPCALYYKKLLVLKCKMCNRGSQGCPGNVPLDGAQCKSHRILARWKAKLAASNGGLEEQNSWIKAVITDKLSAHIRQKGCQKECCRLHPLQVTLKSSKWYWITQIQLIVEQVRRAWIKGNQTGSQFSPTSS